MARGTLNFNASAQSGRYIDSKVEWTSSADQAGNESDVTVKLYARKGDTTQSLTIPTSGSWKYRLSVAGTEVSGTVTKSILEDWVLVASKTVKGINHDSDGKKSITISGSVTAPSGTSFAGHTSKGSGTATLDTIPRASSITSVAATTLGKKCSVKWTPASKSFRYKLKFSLDGWSHTTGAIHPNQTTAYTYTGYTIPLEAARQIMYAVSGEMTVTLYTYSDSDATDRIGSSSATFTVTVPNNDDTRPAVSMELSPVGDLPDAFSGLFVQGKTRLKAEVTAEAKYDAGVLACSVKVCGESYGLSDDFTSELLTVYGNTAVTGYVEDTRGFTRSVTKNITVIPYSKPRIVPVAGESEVIAARCDADGNLVDDGTYLTIRAKRSYSPVKANGVQKNFCRIRYRYKLSGAASYSGWTTILAGDSLDSDEVTTAPLMGGVLSIKESYLVQIRAVDDIGGYSSTLVEIPTDKVYMHRDKRRRALAIGKYIELDNCVDIADDITLKIRGEKWVDLGLSSNVTESASGVGRGDTKSGCFYRAVNGNHIQVAFNCAFSYTGSEIVINSELIPAECRPGRSVYAVCAMSGRAVARVKVNSSGEILVEWVQVLSSADSTAELTVNWIDGHIDYFY